MSGQPNGWDTIRYLNRLGIISTRAVHLYRNARLIEMTGWTPEQIKNMEPEELGIYMTVWGASAQGGNPPLPRQMRKELMGNG